MSRKTKVGRNEPCPCLSGEKFKSCCSGKTNWDAVIRGNLDYRPFLSVRGRNLYFAKRVAEALQLDAFEKPGDIKRYKAAFTADAVKKIHEAILEVWPPTINLSEALKGRSGEVSGLYIGDYASEFVSRAVVRHSIYANKILLIDPFIYPKSVKDEYNPVVNPHEHRAQTLKNVNLWLDFFPWIEAGIVSVIRPPSDFDAQLNWDIMTAQTKKFETNEDLKNASKQTVDELSIRHQKQLAYQQLVLGAPDEYLRRKFRELKLDANGINVEQFIASINEEREQDRDFLEPMGPQSHDQVFTISSGTSYPSAILTANLTGSYLFTDMRVRWREMELDRESHSAENKVWTPFAKALQDAPFRYLNNVRLEHALTLREEGKLDSLRGFLGKVWKNARSENQFDSANAVLLTEELGERVREAEQEWKSIDADLIKIVGPALAGGLFSAGPLIATGHANFLAAAAIIAGVGPLISSTIRRHYFQDRFPAAFFMKIDKENA